MSTERQREQKRRSRKKIYNSRRQQGLCGDCGSSDTGGQSLCTLCKLRSYERNRRHRAKFRTAVQKLTRRAPCYFCSRSAVVLHHLSPEHKDFMIGDANVSLARVEEEIAKCIPVCRACHMKIHCVMNRFINEASCNQQKEVTHG